VLLSSDPPGSTLMGVNVMYAFEAQRAESLGISFYEMHQRNVELNNPASLPEERVIEYPPLTILWMKVPTWFLDPIPKSGMVPDAVMERAKRANLIAMFLVDVCGFGLLALAGATAAQLAVYWAGGLLLFPLLYDRFDLLLGVLLLGAVLLLVRKRPHWAPLTVLAAAINFKMAPLVLAPLFVLGTLPADSLPALAGAPPWRLIGRRLALLTAVGVALFLPFFAKDGFATLDFLRYHAMRGLQIESVWNTLPVAMAAIFRWPARVTERFGAAELQSALSSPLRVIASVATVAVIPVLAFALWKLLNRRETSSMRRGAVTVAQANPELFVRCTVLCLLTAIVVAHVLSPQYLLWLVPLVALWEGRTRRWVWSLFLAICALTTWCYPFGAGSLLDALSAASRLGPWSRLLAVTPLIARNLLLVGVTVWLWIETFRGEPREQGVKGVAGVKGSRGSRGSRGSQG